MADPLTGQLPGKSVGQGLAAKPRPGCVRDAFLDERRSTRSRVCPNYAAVPLLFIDRLPDDGAADGQRR
jgi:hypothetical protein